MKLAKEIIEYFSVAKPLFLFNTQKVLKMAGTKREKTDWTLLKWL